MPPAEDRVSGEEKGDGMPCVDVWGVRAVEVPEGKRLVLAIEEDARVDILHRCGGYARCTTCRIGYVEGELERMTRAKMEVLERKGLLGRARLSCQAIVDHDVKVRPLATVSSTGAEGPGRKPQPEITPEPEWVERPTS
jgi:ferredoxin